MNLVVEAKQKNLNKTGTVERIPKLTKKQNRQFFRNRRKCQMRKKRALAVIAAATLAM